MLNSFNKLSRGIANLFQPALILVMVLWLAGCTQEAAIMPADEESGQPAFELPTSRPSVQPSPANTRVLSAESLTPAPTATITPIPDEAMGLVIEVIDGDTIAVVMDGDPMSLAYQVRYIGIDAPPNSADDPWGVVAYETNRKLANLKIVRLVRDETDFDADGYLLRYVYAGDQLLNTELVVQGLARADIQAPNTSLQKRIQDAENFARQERRGVWGSAPPTVTPGRQPSPESTEEAPATLQTRAITVTVTGTITATVQVTATVEPSSTLTATTEATQEPTQEATEETSSSDELIGQ